MSGKNNIFNSIGISKRYIDQTIQNAADAIGSGIPATILSGCNISFQTMQNFALSAGQIYLYTSGEQSHIQQIDQGGTIALCTETFAGQFLPTISFIPNNHLTSSVVRIEGKFNINRVYIDTETQKLYLLISPNQFDTLSIAIINNQYFPDEKIPPIFKNRPYVYLGAVILLNTATSYDNNDNVIFVNNRQGAPSSIGDDQIIQTNLNELPINGNVDMKSLYRFINVPNAQGAQDLTTKSYVDNLVNSQTASITLKNNNILNNADQVVGQFSSGRLEFKYQPSFPNGIKFLDSVGQFVNLQYVQNTNNNGLYFIDQAQQAIMIIRQDDNSVVVPNMVLNYLGNRTNPLDAMNYQQVQNMISGISFNGGTISQQLNISTSSSPGLICNQPVIFANGTQLTHGATLQNVQNGLDSLAQGVAANYLSKNNPVLDTDLQMNYYGIKALKKGQYNIAIPEAINSVQLQGLIRELCDQISQLNYSALYNAAGL